MNQTVDAILHPDGTIRLLKPIAVSEPTAVRVSVYPKATKEDYEAAIAESNTPEAEQRRAEARADYRANGGLTTPEAIALFNSLVLKAGRS